MQIYNDGTHGWLASLDEILADVAAAGLNCWEPFAGPLSEAQTLAPLLQKHRLQAPSAYANVELHTPEWQRHADACVANALYLQPLGTRLIVVNPTPIKWGGSEDKNDAQLRTQAAGLRYLHEALGRQGLQLAYHTHDPEMRAAAREFHHMMHATRDLGMALCLDAHWIYRGAGNSNVALLDIVERYADRIATLQLRQSHGGTWCELLEAGDIDYVPLVKTLKAAGFDGPAHLEICQEQGTQRTMPLRATHRRSAEWFRSLWEAA
jgi:inosose dehydratase